MVSNTTSPPTPRGVALLIVLAVLMVTVTAASIVLSAATNACAAHRLACADRVAIDLLTASEEPIQWWLSNRSESVVLPPTALQPFIAVLDDSFELPSGVSDEVEVGEDPLNLQITITAFDQRGMVPIQLARSGSPLRLSLPAQVLQLLDSAELPPVSSAMGADLGLDLFCELNNAHDHIEVFPRAIQSADSSDESVVQSVFGDKERLGWLGTLGARGALGGLVATHNRGSSAHINICTAPMPLVKAACRLAGRGGIEQIAAARTSRKRPDIPLIVEGLRVGEPDTSIPTITTTSDCWSFRIDITVNGLKNSWWSTYVRGRHSVSNPRTVGTLGRASGDSSRPVFRAIAPVPGHEWTCVQRLAIDE